MAKGDNQKLKMLYLVKIFQEETDDEHSLTMQEIIDKLKDYGVNADRKTLYTAIDEEKQISFHYFQWNAAGNQVLRRGGALYQVSPQCLMWDDEYYYLVAYDPEAKIIKHFRVDKMKDLTITDKPREGQEAFRSFDMAKYSKSLFGMFSGDPVTVSLLCDNDMAGVIIDRFGEDVPRIPHDDGTFTVHVRVIPGGPFFGWVFGLGGKVKITGPEKVVKQMQEETRKIAAQYLPDYLPDNLTD